MTVASVFIFSYAGYAWWQYRNLNNGLPTGNFNPRAGQTKPDFDGKDQNLLLVGNDDRTGLTDQQVRDLKVGRDGGSLATDTMMIIHVPADGSTATLISLPRDSYVNIPGYGMNKLNAAYALAYNHASGSTNDKRVAGASLLTETVSSLTGLTIDHFIQVTLLGFVLISDAVGGVQINLCHAVNDTVAYNRSIGSDGGSGLVLSAGRHTIKGVTALEFVRQRHNLPNGDLDRTARQRYFLTQAFRAVASTGTLLNPGRLSSLVSAVDHSIWVDSHLDLTNLALQMSSLDPSHIIGKAIPFNGFENTSVGSVEVINPAQVQTFVKNLISPAPKPSTSASKPSTSHPATSHSTTSAKPSSACIN